jgi:cell division protein FtsQ
VTGVPRRSPWGSAVLVLVMVGLAGWLVANSAVFAARDIRVLGNVNLTADRVQQLARLRVGDNLLRIRTAEAVRYLERNPWVARASVDRSLPSTVVVRIVERKPVAWMRDRRGYLLVAGDGIVLGRSSERPRGLPFAGRTEATLKAGARAPHTPVLRVAGSLPAELGESVRTIRLEEGQVVLGIRGGEEAHYGSPTGLPAKHQALMSVLGWAREHAVGAGTIDVRFPRTPSLQAQPSRG